MTLRPCPREREVMELVRRGQWPDRCAEDLRKHVDGCRACGELVLVMQAFRASRAESLGAPAPEAGPTELSSMKVAPTDSASARASGRTS